MELTKAQIEKEYNKTREEDVQYYTYDLIPEKDIKEIIESYNKSKDETNK